MNSAFPFGSRIGYYSHRNKIVGTFPAVTICIREYYSLDISYSGTL
ncbi:MAG: hypothetical protein LIP08_07100 [Bacteroides sp.]|nr:hypothetical protein [Bacteroides sp.]